VPSTVDSTGWSAPPEEYLLQNMTLKAWNWSLYWLPHFVLAVLSAVNWWILVCCKWLLSAHCSAWNCVWQ
jgi:hypothetical protein